MPKPLYAGVGNGGVLLCTNWVYPVFSRGTSRAQNTQFYPVWVWWVIGHVNKTRRFTHDSTHRMHRLIPLKNRRFTEVIPPLIPTIHSTYKENDKLYIKKILVLTGDQS